MNMWGEVMLPDIAGTTSMKQFATVMHLKATVISALADVGVDGCGTFTFRPDMIDVQLCSASFPVGGALDNDRFATNRKWYNITCTRLLEELDTWT
eukprot:1700168-Pyramimonas_sp.AAC.1